MNQLKYNVLEMQEYLEHLNVNEAKTVFRFRTRMQNFDGNYKGKNNEKLCPVCALHVDRQEFCFNCPGLRKIITITDEYESIFGSTITSNIARTLVNIDKIRKEYLSLKEAQMCTTPNSVGAASIVKFL